MPKQAALRHHNKMSPVAVEFGTRPHNASDRQESKSESAIHAYTQIAKDWKLSDPEAAALLGVELVDWETMRSQPEAASLDEQVLARFGDLLRIYVALHIIFQDDVANAWVRSKSTVPLLEGMQPIQAMIAGGSSKIEDVRDHLDAASVGL